MTRGDAVVVNRLGLHARAAARFVQMAAQFTATVRVGVADRFVDGKSILGLLLLAAAQGVRLVIETDGPDEQEAQTALVELVARGFEDAS